jgi:hypothetical protein
MYNVLKGGKHEVSMRWVVKGLPLEDYNETGSVGEPFAAINHPSGATTVLTKEAVFYESDEERSSVHHPQVERERG